MPRNTGTSGRSRASAEARAPAFPGHHDVARRAYELWVDRGMGPGLDRDDWLQAERELLDRAARKATAPARKAAPRRRPP